MTNVIAALLALVLPAPDLGPVLPPRTSPYIMQLNYRAQKLISESKFDEASKEMDGWPGTVIGYDATALPASFAKSLTQAAKIWQDAMDGKVKFVQSDKPLVQFGFVQDSKEGLAAPEWKDGKVHADIPLNWGAGIAMPKETMTWALAKTFGVALGLQPRSQRFTVMGFVMYQPDTAKFTTSIGVDAAERALALQVFSARETLAAAIAKKQTLIAAVPKLDIDKTYIDGGTTMQGNKVRFAFTLVNSGNVPVRIESEVNCHCVLLRPISTLEANSNFVLEPELDTLEFRGPLERHVMLYTNDPLNPVRDLTIHVLSLPEYRLLPDQLQVVWLNDEGETQYPLTFYPTPGNSVEAVNTQLSRPGVTATIVPWTGDVVDALFGKDPVKRTGSQVVLKFPADYKQGIDFLRVIVISNSKRNAYSEANLQTQKGIVAQPKTVFFGTMRVGQSDTRTVSLEHGFTPFNITSLSAVGPFAARFEKDGDSGRKYKITVFAKPEKSGYINGKIIVKTDSAKYPLIEIPVSLSAQR